MEELIIIQKVSTDKCVFLLHQEGMVTVKKNMFLWQQHEWEAEKQVIFHNQGSCTRVTPPLYVSFTDLAGTKLLNY